jgi:hypothetical protein
LTLPPDHVSSSNRRPRQSNSNTHRDGTVEIGGQVFVPEHARTFV